MNESSSEDRPIDRLRKQFEQFQEDTAKKFCEELAAKYQDQLQQTQGRLFSAAQTLESDLKQLAQDAKASQKQKFLTDVINIANKIVAGKLQSVEDVRDEIQYLLESNDVRFVAVRAGDSFNPAQHNTIAEVRGSCWKFRNDDRPLTKADVVVYEHHGAASPVGGAESSENPPPAQ